MMASIVKTRRETVAINGHRYPVNYSSRSELVRCIKNLRSKLCTQKPNRTQ
jgi:hypothetical protein